MLSKNMYALYLILYHLLHQVFMQINVIHDIPRADPVSRETVLEEVQQVLVL